MADSGLLEGESNFFALGDQGTTITSEYDESWLWVPGSSKGAGDNDCEDSREPQSLATVTLYNTSETLSIFELRVHRPFTVGFDFNILEQEILPGESMTFQFEIEHEYQLWTLLIGYDLACPDEERLSLGTVSEGHETHWYWEETGIHTRDCL